MMLLGEKKGLNDVLSRDACAFFFSFQWHQQQRDTHTHTCLHLYAGLVFLVFKFYLFKKKIQMENVVEAFAADEFDTIFFF